MKKTFIYMTTLLLGLFISFSNVKAATKVALTESDNGKVSTKLHFDEGFVGGVDVAFKVTGNVNVSNFAFSSKVSNNKNKKTYSYDSKNKVLKVRVTSGGIGTSHNLLNSNKELDLGNVVLSTSSKETVSYSLAPTSLKVVDNSWNAKTISTNDDDKKSFSYKVTTLENNPSSSNTPSSGNTNSTTSSGGTSNKSSTNKSSKSTNSNNAKSSQNNTTSSNKNSSTSNSGINKIDITKNDNDTMTDENGNEVAPLDDLSEDFKNSDIVTEDTKSSDEKSAKNSTSEVKKENKKKKGIIPFVIGTFVLAFVGIYVTIKNRY